jgi:hypothetical protein
MRNFLTRSIYHYHWGEKTEENELAGRSERWEMFTDVWLKNVKGKGHLERLSVAGSIILKQILKKESMSVWTGFDLG